MVWRLNPVAFAMLLRAAADRLSEDDLYDAAFDALLNDAPEVESFTAEQDKGAYHVVIRGVPGAYFVSALEYDHDGFFDDLDEAERAVYRRFGEFLVDP
jgi:hypothetical protein